MFKRPFPEMDFLRTEGSFLCDPIVKNIYLFNLSLINLNIITFLEKLHHHETETMRDASYQNN